MTGRKANYSIIKHKRNYVRSVFQCDFQTHMFWHVTYLRGLLFKEGSKVIDLYAVFLPQLLTVFCGVSSDLFCLLPPFS